VGVLGPVELFRDGGPIKIGPPKQRMILALLALRSGDVVSTDHLVEALWAGKPPPTARTALRVYVSELRKRIDERGELILGQAPGYRLALPPTAIDVRQFENLWQEGRELLDGSRVDDAAQTLSAALALWRGPPLADLAHADAFAADVRRLEEMRRACVLDLIDADLGLGKHAGLIGKLEQIVADEPLHERSRAQLMLALYRSGRQAESLAVYRRGREALVEELGIEPSPVLGALERQILHHDPALDPPLWAKGPARRAVVVASQSSKDVEGLLSVGAPIVQKADAELILVRILTALPGRNEVERLRELTVRLSRHRDALEADGVATRVAALSSSTPGQDLLKLATQQDAALILIDGSRELLQGRSATAAELLADAPCDVALHVPHTRQTGETILVPFGASDHDWAALELGAHLAQQTDKPLVIAGVEADNEGVNISRLLASASLVLQRATGVIAEPLVLATGGARSILQAASDARLIVLGVSSRYATEGFGETRTTIAHEAAAPCLYVRRGSRPSIVAPPESMTRFAWSLPSQGG
jgi:DNA-binding SARP family transcriptional activator